MILMVVNKIRLTLSRAHTSAKAADPVQIYFSIFFLIFGK